MAIRKIFEAFIILITCEVNAFYHFAGLMILANPMLAANPLLLVDP